MVYLHFENKTNISGAIVNAIIPSITIAEVSYIGTNVLIKMTILSVH